MGACLKIYIIKDDDSLHRLPLTNYQRLIQFDSQEKLIQYAGKRIRCCSLIIEFKDRKPQKIIQSQYFYLNFGNDGRLDPLQRETEFKELLNSWFDICMGQFEDNVLDFRKHFRQKQFINRYRWIPNPEIETAIEDDIFSAKSLKCKVSEEQKQILTFINHMKRS